MIDSYFTIEKSSEAEIKVSKSKFISLAFPIKSLTDVQNNQYSVNKKYFDASHHPFAFRLGIDKNKFRFFDDGEPSGSSGKPILDALDKYNVTDALVVVVRYYGGIKLGTGGLRKAYFDAADLCLKNSVKIEKFIMEKLNLEFEYRFINIIMNLIETEDLKLLNNNSDERCKLTLDVGVSKVSKIMSDLVNLTGGNIAFK